MAKVYDRLIVIEKQDPTTEEWTEFKRVHASINKASNDNEYLGSGASQSKRNLTFEIRYFSDIETIDADRQHYRVIYRGVPYSIEDIDDYMLKHKTVKILGVSY